jgi:hypothetical protein
VRAEELGPAFIGDVKYDIVIKSDCIYSGDGKTYVYLIKQKKTFWYEINYIDAVNVTVVKQDGNKCAVAFPDGDYTITDRLLVAWEKPPCDGEEVYIDQKDIRELQLIKAAIFAGCKILMDVSSTSPNELSCVILAGAFGNYIDIKNAQYIGLIPDVGHEKVISIGNAAGVGAKLALRSCEEKNRAMRLANNATFIELANRLDFQDEYVEGMLFNNAIV